MGHVVLRDKSVLDLEPGDEHFYPLYRDHHPEFSRRLRPGWTDWSGVCWRHSIHRAEWECPEFRVRNAGWFYLRVERWKWNDCRTSGLDFRGGLYRARYKSGRKLAVRFGRAQWANRCLQPQLCPDNCFRLIRRPDASRGLHAIQHSTDQRIAL